MTATDPLEALWLKHVQWSNMLLDQIEPDDYPELFDTIAAAIAAWEKEREHGFGRSLEATTSIARRHEALRAEVLKVAEEMGASDLGPGAKPYYVKKWAARLRKACE